MKREHMTRVIAKELHHIPEQPDNPAQQELRMLFNKRRLQALGRDPATPRQETLRSAVDFLKNDYPDFDPEYDKDYFA